MVDKNTMLDANRSALNFHISSVERVQKLCDPLKYLGITSFGYLKIFNDSRYLRINNEDKWSRYFIENVHDMGKVFSRLFSLANSEVISLVWPEETTDDLLLALKSHDMFHGITFCKQTDGFVESWNFCTELGNTGIYELYFNHGDLLWKFIQYFSECAPDLIDHSDRGKLGIYKNGYNIPPSKSVVGQGSVEKFLRGIETKEYFLKCNQTWAFISEIERQCLEAASRGVRESNSLVCTCLDNVKLRLGIASIDELLEAFKSSQR